MENPTQNTHDNATQNTQPVQISGQNNSAAADPFATQRDTSNNPFMEKRDSVTEMGSSPTSKSKFHDTDEWDASKTLPSAFQKRKGSIHATPSSRDGHVERNTQHAYLEKLKEKGWHKK